MNVAEAFLEKIRREIDKPRPSSRRRSKVDRTPCGCFSLDIRASVLFQQVAFQNGQKAHLPNAKPTGTAQLKIRLCGSAVRHLSTRALGFYITKYFKNSCLGSELHVTCAADTCL